MISFAKVSPGQGRRFINMPTGLSPYTFYMMHSGSKLFDSMTGVNAQCSISGIRYGVVNGQVTQFAANSPPVEDNGLRACPAFTQLAKYTEDLTNAAWSKADFSNPVLAGTFQGQNTWACSENTIANTYHQISQSGAFNGVADNSVIGVSVIAKYKNRKILISVQAKDGSYKTGRFNLQTGVVEVNSGGLAANIASLDAGYYRLFFAVNVLTGATTPAIRIQLFNGISSQYTGDGVSGVYLGQPTYINFGVNGIPFIPPYVPNNTGNNVSVVSEAATATTGTSFDLDNDLLTRLKTALRGPNAQGHLELEFVSNVDSGWLPNSTALNIFTVANNNVGGGLYYWRDSSGGLSFRLSDSVNLAVNLGTTRTGQTFKIILDWGYLSGALKMILIVDGVKSSIVDFSGSFGGQDLRIGYNTPVPIHIKNIKILPRPIW